MLSIWRSADSRPDVALDRHDCPEHRGSCYAPLSVNYVPKPGERVVEVRLEYDSDGNIVQR